MTKEHALRVPSSINGLKEYRAAIDMVTLPLRMSYLKLVNTEDIGKGRTVFVLPGFGATDATMYPLRFFLEKYGFKALGWGLGRNKAGMDKSYDPASLSWGLTPPEPYRGETGVPFLCDSMVHKIREYHQKTNEQVILVGWSLGGTIAREVARDLPEIVEHVVTLGSPLIGGPKYTAAAKILAKRGLNLDWIEHEVNKRNQIPLKCKSTSIVSPTDGVVGYSASMIPEDGTTDYIDLDVAHLGMGINGKAISLVLNALREE